MKALALIVAVSWIGLWLTPDQQGARLLERGEHVLAAQTFEDPLWQGVAWYRAGEFERAAKAFARRGSPEAWFDQGNARLMHGDYQGAIGCYDRALEARPDWTEARENRALAEARRAALEFEGGDMTEGMLGADDTVFDDKAGSSDQQQEAEGGPPLSDAQIQALWLRRVQTRPADFLAAKFEYQHARRVDGDER